MIPMVNLKAQYAEIESEIEAGLRQTIADCAFILGPNVRAFEAECADYLGVRHAVGVASGTDALHLALLAAGVGRGDEVITTAFTFIATAEAICYVGAKPVFVDIDPGTFNISPDAIERAVTPKTRAVMPVHLFGQPADMTAIAALCERRGLKLIEDCCQSFGASIAGRQTGTLGHLGGFSFFPSKNLGAFGDGGLVTTDDDAFAATIRKLRNHGSDIRYYHDLIGFNSRLDEMQAVVLRAKLKRIDRYNQARRAVAREYSRRLAGLPLTTPHEDGIGIHVYHQYTLLTERRDALLEVLQQARIGCAVYYPVPLHRQRVFVNDYGDVNLPVTDRVASQCLSLPICPYLEERHMNKIIEVVTDFLT